MRIENRTRPRPLITALIVSFVLGALITLISGPQTPRLGTATSATPNWPPTYRTSLTTEVGYQSLSAARFQNGQTTYAGIGTAADGPPPTPQTPFEAGSITKTFTGSLLADAVRRGEMRLNDPVSTYLTELEETAVGATTLEQLATHTGGLPPFPDDAAAGVAARIVTNGNSYGGSVAAMIDGAATTKIDKRGSYRYSNLGMALLGHAEARDAKVPDWPTLATERLLRPLGMRHTRFAIQAADIPATGARPHDENGWPGAYWYGPAFTPAGSSTWTTAEDLMIFARAALDGTLPGSAALDPITEIPGVRSDWPGIAVRSVADRSPGTTAPPAVQCRTRARPGPAAGGGHLG